MAGSPRPNLEASRLARLLEKTGAQLVLAESCTGGMAAALLTQIPGVSRYFCGSAVVYQSETKSAWLKIRRSELADHGAESLAITERLATQILARTPRATISGAITGDLGPLSPSEKARSRKVGVIFVACATKTRSANRTVAKLVLSSEVRLRIPSSQRAAQTRILLQQVASMTLHRMVRQVLSDTLRHHRGIQSNGNEQERKRSQPHSKK